MSRSESGSALFDEHPQSLRIRSRFSSPEDPKPGYRSKRLRPGIPPPASNNDAAGILGVGPPGSGMLYGRVEPTTVRHQPLCQKT